MQPLIGELADRLGYIFIYPGSREVEVLTRRAYGETLEEIAQDHGITRERIRQIEKEAKEYLKTGGHWDLINLLGRIKNESKPIPVRLLHKERMGNRRKLELYFNSHPEAFYSLSYRSLYSLLGIAPSISLQGDVSGVEMGRQVHADFKPLSRLGSRIWCRGCHQYLEGEPNFAKSVVDRTSSFNYCRCCIAIRTRNYIEGHKDHHNAVRRDYYEKVMTENPEMLRRVQKKHQMRKKLGLTGPRRKYF